MKKALTTNGNSWYLYINKPIANMLGLNQEEYSVDLKIEKQILYVSKSTEKSTFLTKKLIKRSSGFGLNFPLVILELLEINPEKDMLDIDLVGNKLKIKKLN